MTAEDAEHGQFYFESPDVPVADSLGERLRAATTHPYAGDRYRLLFTEAADALVVAATRDQEAADRLREAERLLSMAHNRGDDLWNELENLRHRWPGESGGLIAEYVERWEQFQATHDAWLAARTAP